MIIFLSDFRKNNFQYAYYFIPYYIGHTYLHILILFLCYVLSQLFWLYSQNPKKNLTSYLSYLYPYLPFWYYRSNIGSSGTRRRVDRDRDFLGSISSRAGTSGFDQTDLSLLGSNSTSSPLTLSTEDLSIVSNSGGHKVNVNASATSNIKEENPDSSYHQQEHKQT